MRWQLLFATGVCWFSAISVPHASAVPPFHMHFSRFPSPHFNQGFRAFVPPTNTLRIPVAPTSTSRGLNNFIGLNNFLAVQPFNNQLLANKAFNDLMRGNSKNNINNFATLPRNPIGNSIQPAAGTTTSINYSANPYYPYVNPWRTVPTGWNGQYPYAWNPYPASYAYPSTYASAGYAGGSYGGGGGYGSAPSYGGAGYGSVPTYNPYSAYADMTPAAAPDAKNNNSIPTLTAFAIPNEGGRVTWPLAFRLMNPDQKKDLLDKLEAQLQIVATQAAGGKANPLMLDQAAQTVEKLHQWLRTRRDQIAAGTHRDGEAFLRKLETALKAMGG
jgi:hypothetical protein